MERHKLPVWRTAKESFALVFANFGYIVAIGWPPFALSFALGHSLIVLASLDPKPGGPAARMAVFAVGYAVLLVLSIAFAVRWHRLVLLGERVSLFKGLLSGRDLGFLAFYIVMVGPLVIPAVGINYFSLRGLERAPEVASSPILILQLTMIVGALWFFAVLGYALVLPSIAVESRLRLAQARRALRGNTWRWLGASVLVSAPVLPLASFLSPVVLATLGGGSGVVLAASLASSALGVVHVALLVAVLSIAYRHALGSETSGVPGPPA